ncbi:hypothetical protein GCM10022221_10960 [Actinocorallia aurea]
MTTGEAGLPLPLSSDAQAAELSRTFGCVRLVCNRALAQRTRAIRLREGRLTLAKVDGPLEIVWSRPLPAEAEPSTVTVPRDAAGRWVSLLCEDLININVLPPDALQTLHDRDVNAARNLLAAGPAES